MTELIQPTVIRLFNSLTQVYRIMRERQKDIDAAFDRAAAQIGFVVTSTLPVRVEIAEEGVVKGISFDGAALRGTIFEKELSGFLEEFRKKPFSGVPAGKYRFYLIWYDALNLKLRCDWCEPAHLLQSALGSIMAQRAGVTATALVPPEVHEPAHWFDPGVAIAVEDGLVIMAIDEVYPELRLADRISAGRLAIAQFAWRGRYEPNEMVAAPYYFNERFASKEQDVLAKVRALLGNQFR